MPEIHHITLPGISTPGWRAYIRRLMDEPDCIMVGQETENKDCLYHFWFENDDTWLDTLTRTRSIFLEMTKDA